MGKAGKILTRTEQIRRVNSITGKIRDRASANPVPTIPTDFRKFARLCKIRSQSAYVPFDLYDYQIEVAKLLDRYPKIAIAKTRQLGASELITCKMDHRMLLNPAYSGVVFSIGQDESSKIAERARSMVSGIPTVEWESASSMRLKARGLGSILFRPSTENAGRSLPSVTDIFLDEAGFIKGAVELYGNAMPSQSMAGSDCKTYIVSTLPKEGELSWFWTIFSQDTPSTIDIDYEIARVREGRGEAGGGLTWWVDNAGWCKILLHWRSHPIYSSIPDYLAHTKLKLKLTEDSLQREYNLQLPTAGGSLFNTEAIKNQAIGAWSEPQPRRRYLMGIDPNFGGGDYYRAQAWDITTTPYALVAEYKAQNQATETSKTHVLDLIDRYRPVIVAMESNSGGLPQMESLIIARPWCRFEKVATTNASKRVNTDRIALALEQGEVIYPPDWDGVAEMRRFLATERCAANGWHDDAVMAWAAAWAWLGEALSAGVSVQAVAVEPPKRSPYVGQLDARGFL